MCTVGIRYYNLGYHRSLARPEADGEKDACLLSLVIRVWVTVTPGRRNSGCRGTEAIDGSGVRLERGAFGKLSIISRPQFLHL